MFVFLFIAVTLGIAYKISIIRPEWTGGLAIAWIFIFFISLFFGYARMRSRCKRCKKNWAYEVVSKELYKKENIYVTEYKEKYDYYDKQYRSYPIQVPAIKCVYEIKEKCCFCGHEKKPYFETEITKTSDYSI